MKSVSPYLVYHVYYVYFITRTFMIPVIYQKDNSCVGDRHPTLILVCNMSFKEICMAILSFDKIRSRTGIDLIFIS